MTIEATARTNAFAAFQQKLVSAGIRVGSPSMTGLQQAAQFYAAAVADEAVAGATLCLTEHDIAHAISMWADEENAQGEMVRAMQLRQAAATILRAAKDMDEERAKAVLRLPPSAPELPRWIRDRVDGVLRLVYGEKADAAPIHRLFATVVHELVRTATGQAPSDVNAPAPLPISRDASLAEFIAMYAMALVTERDCGIHEAERAACRATWDAINRDGFHLTGVLAETATRRGFSDARSFSDYLRALPLGQLPEAWETAHLVPTPAQQQQARDSRKAEDERPTIAGVHLAGQEMGHSLVGLAALSPAGAMEAALAFITDMGSPELARTVRTKLSTVPQFEAHNFPGTPGGDPLEPLVPMNGVKMVSTMIQEGGVHLPTWQQAVEACAAWLRENGTAVGLTVAMVDDVKPPKAG